MGRKTLIATRDFVFTTLKHQTCTVTAGEVFEAEPIEAAALVYQHKAKFTSSAAARQAGSDLDSPRRRRYRRRDLRAEE